MFVVAAEVLPDAEAFVLIGAAAFTLPLLAGRIGLPAIVLEIVFGAVIGPEVLGLIAVADQESIALLAELGLLLLMFLAGFEVDFERIERQGVTQIAWGLGLYGLILGASWIGAGFLETESTSQRVFLALLVSAASVGLVVPALRVTRQSATSLGQAVLITALLAEFLSLIGIVILGVWVEEGVGIGLASIPVLFAGMALTLVVVRRTAWWYPERFSRLFSEDDPDELGIRASLALMFVFVGVSLALGIEAILGAFLAGALFAFVFRNTGTLEERLSGFAFGFFIPIFFINVGIGFPVGRLGEPAVLGTAAGLIAVAVVVKMLPSLALLFRGFGVKETLAAGILLAGQLSVIIALADLGVDLNLMSSDLAAGAILLVAVTAVVSPVAFRLLVGTPEGAAEPASSAH